MNHVYELITQENAGSLSFEQLIGMYNDAVEMIWFLQKQIDELSEENEGLWDNYEELTDHLYG